MVHGFGGSATRGVKQGTLLWRWIDDDGQEHMQRIPNSYYVPDGGHRLLSPQHWAQECPKERCHCDTTAQGVVLEWGTARKYRLTLTHNPSTNVADIEMAAGFKGTVAFLTEGEDRCGHRGQGSVGQ